MKFQLTKEEGEFLVGLARRAVEEYLTSRNVISMPKDTPNRLTCQCGVFVTINLLEKRKKRLRGCIGYPYQTTKLAQAVVECAISAATQDPRFPPLYPGELSKIVFEVSVLTPPELVNVENPKDMPSKIKVGRDGLIIERGPYKGLLLPQVATEQNWDEEDFLSNCCIKAGLTPDSWLLNRTKIYSFQAIVFEEENPRGKIRRKTFGGE